MKRAWIVIALSVLILGGCAAAKQAGEDLKTGLTAPLEQGETAPKDSARSLTDIMSAIPYVNVAAPVALPVLTWFFAWKRGRRIRKGLPTSANPITGKFGQQAGLEALVQHVSDVVAGITEVGKDGSGLKRAWKVGVITLGGLLGTALALPSVQEFLVAHPDIIASITLISSTLAGFEKKLSQVLPVDKQPTAEPI